MMIENLKMENNYPSIIMSADSSGSDSKSVLNLLQLPEEVLLHILSFVNYHNVSEIRMACRGLNKMCQHGLTQGFNKVDKFHAAIQRQVKTQLPRRESERRNHPLARHVDILSAIETRLSLLSMTYMKYIDVGLCSFIPGKVLDELFRILRILQDCSEPPRAHEFLQELRDISSMAMEHFEEKIVPTIKPKIPSIGLPIFGEQSIPHSGQSLMGNFPLPVVPPPMRAFSMRQDVMKVQCQIRSHGLTLQNYRKEIVDLKNKSADQRKRLSEQEKKISDQGRIVSEQSNRLLEQEKKIGDLSRRILEYDQKFNDVFAELTKLSGNTDEQSALVLPSSSCKSRSTKKNGNSEKRLVETDSEKCRDEQKEVDQDELSDKKCDKLRTGCKRRAGGKTTATPTVQLPKKAAGKRRRII